MGFSERVTNWKEKGHLETFRNNTIHCYYQSGNGVGPLLVICHGYPTCSYDWNQLISQIPERPLLIFDFLGFGLSDKPSEHNYSLLWQADLTEEIIQRHLNKIQGEKLNDIILIGHDMGTSVVCELLSRDIEGTLRPGINLIGAFLFNGNMIMERSSLILGQRLLRSFLGPFAAKLTFSKAFRWQLGTVFSRDHPLSEAEGEDQWALMSYKNGHAINHKLIQYTFERVERADRWLGAVRDWKKPLTFAWGMEDPVATTWQLDGWKELRPKAQVVEICGLAHYPQIEDPNRFKTIFLSIIDNITTAAT